MGTESGWIHVWGMVISWEMQYGEKTKKHHLGFGRGRYEDAVRGCPHEHSEVVGIQSECFVWEMLL